MAPDPQVWLAGAVRVLLKRVAALEAVGAGQPAEKAQKPQERLVKVREAKAQVNERDGKAQVNAGDTKIDSSGATVKVRDDVPMFPCTASSCSEKRRL